MVCECVFAVVCECVYGCRERTVCGGEEGECFIVAVGWGTIVGTTEGSKCV